MRYKKEALKEINEVMPALIQNLARKEGKAHPERRIETIKKIKTALDEMRESVKRKHTEGANGSTVSRMLSENIDYLIQELFTAYSTLFFGKNTNEAGINLSVVAIGGYGRSELQPFSDIDIFFLFKESLKSAESNIVSSIVTALWDFGFEVGHVARTASECIALIKSDLPSKTALIDSRFLLGNPDLYREFKTRLTAEITKNSVQSVIGFTLDELKTRHKKYGDTVFVAEPNIKEGVGGLRDYQSALWVSAAKFSTNTIEGLHTRGIIGSEEKRAVLEAVDFLLRVRNELHFLNARREDTLLFEFQNKVAHLLGYGEEKEDIDRFVKDYFHHASTVAKFSRSTFHSCQTYKKFSPFTLLQLKKKNLGSGFERIGSLIFVKGYNPDIFKKDPVLLLDIFLLCQDKELTLSEPAKKLISLSDKALDDTFLTSPHFRRKIVLVFEGAFTGKILRLMHETGVLEKILPEIGPIVFFSARDHYHFYTVDEHTLRTIEIFDTPLWEETHPELYKIFLEIEEKDEILLALLFHDIQKLGTPEHAERGAAVAKRVLTRWGLEKKVDNIVRLVRCHVLMGYTALRRDLDDIQVIQGFCKSICCVDELKKLYVMTCADIQSVAPTAWSDWKGVMLKELFLRSYTYLENRENLSDPSRVEKKKEEFYQTYPELKAKVDTYLSYIPNSVILSMLTEHVPHYLDLMQTLTASNISIGVFKNSKMNHWELMVCTRSKPGVFAKIAGALSLNRVNILGGRIFTRPDKIAIDLFKISTSALEGAFSPNATHQEFEENIVKEYWERIKKDIRSLLEGQVTMDELIQKKGGGKIFHFSSPHTIGTRIEILNDISEKYTVIDVVTEDRPALLFKLTDTLYKNELNIHLAKVITEGKTAIDVFYITNLNGKRLVDKKKSGILVSSIMRLLN